MIELSLLSIRLEKKQNTFFLLQKEKEKFQTFVP